MNLIWATRGRAWGFRFLRTAGTEDPLPMYEAIFAGLESEPEVWRRVGNAVAVRISDPEGRKDQSGRDVFHDFVLNGDAAQGINSRDDFLKTIWPLLAEDYQKIYDSPQPPTKT